MPEDRAEAEVLIRMSVAEEMRRLTWNRGIRVGLRPKVPGPHFHASGDAEDDEHSHGRVNAEPPGVVPERIAIAHPGAVDLEVDERRPAIEVVVRPRAGGIEPGNARVRCAGAHVGAAEVDTILRPDHAIDVNIEESERVLTDARVRLTKRRHARGDV